MGKIGVGVYGFSQEVLDALIKMQASPILLCDPPVDFYLKLRAALPKSFIALRRYRREDVEQPLDRPLAAARDMAEYVLDLALHLPGLNAVMSYNETPADVDSMIRYDMFQVDFISEVQIRFGIPVIAHNFGVGNPQVAQAIGPYDPHNDALIRYMWRSTTMAKYLGVHSYGAQGQSMDGPDQAWYALRHRFNQASLKAAGVHHGPFIATESGSNQNWRDTMTPDEYFRQLSWFQDQLNQDGPDFMGQCTFGIWGNGKWSGYDLLGTTMIDKIAAYNAAH